MRAPRSLARLARVRAQARRMNEGDRVVRHAIETSSTALGGGEFHDTSGGHELAGFEPHLLRMGFNLPTMPDDL